MTRAPKVSTKITIHQIDDRDLRIACTRRWLVNPQELLEAVRQARLEREANEIAIKIRSVLAQGEAAAARGQSQRKHLDRVLELEKEQERIHRERFGVNYNGSTKWADY